MAEETEEGTVTVNELDCLFKLLHVEMNAMKDAKNKTMLEKLKELLAIEIEILSNMKTDAYKYGLVEEYELLVKQAHEILESQIAGGDSKDDHVMSRFDVAMLKRNNILLQRQIAAARIKTRATKRPRRNSVVLNQCGVWDTVVDTVVPMFNSRYTRRCNVKN